MKKIKLSLEVAGKMYNSTDEVLKAFALENYPELGLKITDRVKTFEDACKIMDIHPSSSFFKEGNLRPHEIAQRKIETIITVLNEEWIPNWDDSSEYKYRPYFKMSSSCSGFSYGDYDFAYSFSVVGSRLVFKNKELAIYAANQFTDIYKEMFTL